MNKIICDICGSAYPESAEQCPICGSAKQIDSKIVSETVSESAEQPVKTATKGGHFSNTNVRKRNKGKAVPVASRKPAKTSKPAQKQAKADKPVKSVENSAEQNTKKESVDKSEKSNRGLLTVVWVLLIAVILVLAYIVVQFVLPMYGIELPQLLGKPDETTSAVDNTTVGQDTTPEDTGVACTGMTVAGGDIVFDAAGRAWLLEVSPQPANTTDVVVFESADEKVATVSDQGRVTSVGPGKTVITVTCGTVTKQIAVECNFVEETTVPEETTQPEDTTQIEDTTAPETTEEPATEETTEPTQTTEPPAENIGLFKQDDVTLAYNGETFDFEVSGELYSSEIYWSSDDPSVAIVENGTVTAVGPGETVIRGEYNGRTDSCIIRCDFDDTDADPGEDEGEDEHPEWPHLYPAEDVSIAVGERFGLTYVNEDGEWPSIEWSSDDSDIAEVDGDYVTGVSYGVTTVRGTYNGEEITCIVRVIN